MSTYVMGEIATVLGITALAGMLIGWCIKSLFTGRGERLVREQVARSVDDATADVRQVQGSLQQKETELQDTVLELQQLRGREVSLKAGNSSQIEEINKLKSELAISRQSLDRNRADFNEFRNEKQTELQSLTTKLTTFQAGGPVHDEHLKEASETIVALRTAVRENDKVIDSLRARVKEGDNSVENLRSQLKNAETTTQQVQASKQTSDKTTVKLTTDLQETTESRDKFKRDYEQLLENKNAEIQKLQSRIEELANVQTLLKAKEHEYNKLNLETRDIAARGSAQITELKRTISDKDSALAQANKDVKGLQKRAEGLTLENQTKLSQTQRETTDVRGKLSAANRELEKNRTLQTQLQTKDAEVVALNDMLRSVSSKRDKLQIQASDLDKQLNAVKSDAAATIEAQRRITKLSNTVKERDGTIAKLRTEMDDVVVSRNSLGLQLGELQTVSAKAEQKIISESQSQLTSVNQAMQERESNIKKLRADMDSIITSRNSLTSEVETLKARSNELESTKQKLQETIAKRESEVEQRKGAYEKLQREFDLIANTRDDYEQRLNKLRAEIDEQARSSVKEIAQLKPQIADLRSKLSLADSEKQRLSEELSRAEGLRLTVTERDAEVQKLQIELQDAVPSGPAKIALNEQQRKTDTLTSALQERDLEISRLSSMVTDNRLASKQTQSENALLQQEIDSQGQLIRSLEEQAENTLSLHKKIASQSTEIEELRAQVYQENDGATASLQPAVIQSDTIELQSLQTQLQSQKNESLMLRQQLEQSRQSVASSITGSNTQSAELQRQNAQLKSELKNIQQDLQRANATVATRSSNVTTTVKSAPAVSSTAAPAKAAQAVATSTGGTSAAKPRIFVRQEETSATSTLTGTSSETALSRRALYTRDGYKLKLPDGSDDLTLLPGVNSHRAQELKRNGVVDFEQITFWTRREVIHFADRTGIDTRTAEGYNWPEVARTIINGSFRKSSTKETDSSGA